MSDENLTGTPGNWLPILVGLTVNGTLAISIMAPALPDAALEFGVSFGTMQWAISLPMLMIAASLVLIGPMADRYGRRPLVISGLILHVVGSIISACAWNATILVIGRVIQAVGCATSVALPRTIARDVLSGKDLARAMSIIAGSMALAPAVALMAAGIFVAFGGWRATMVATAVFGTLMIVCAILYCHETLRVRSTAALTPSGIGFQYRQLLSNRVFLAHASMFAGTGAGFYVFLIYASKRCIVDLGMRPELFAAVILLAAGGYFVGTMISLKLLKSMDFSKLIRAGAILSAIAILMLLAFSEWLSPLSVLAPTFLYCLGHGLVYPNAMYGSLRVDGKLAGSASAMVGSCQFLLSMLVTVAVGTLAHSNVEAAAIAAATACLVWGGILLVRASPVIPSHEAAKPGARLTVISIDKPLPNQSA